MYFLFSSPEIIEKPSGLTPRRHVCPPTGELFKVSTSIRKKQMPNRSNAASLCRMLGVGIILCKYKLQFHSSFMICEEIMVLNFNN